MKTRPQNQEFAEAVRPFVKNATNLCKSVPGYALVQIRAALARLLDELLADQLQLAASEHRRSLGEKIHLASRGKMLSRRSVRLCWQLLEWGNLGAHPEERVVPEWELRQKAREAILRFGTLMNDSTVSSSWDR